MKGLSKKIDMNVWHLKGIAISFLVPRRNVIKTILTILFFFNYEIIRWEKNAKFRFHNWQGIVMTFHAFLLCINSDSEKFLSVHLKWKKFGTIIEVLNSGK